VVRVTDVDQSTTGLAFIVMEYLEGRTLQTLYEDLYRAGQRLSYEDALDYSLQMLEGVEAAHRTGVVHRDLKPDNVMITKNARGEPLIKLLDFGIAKLRVTGQLERGLTRPGVIMGTPEYMAPEQAYSADAVDSRADIFSLGVMIFEMLAGRRPVGGDEATLIASQYLQGNVAKLRDLAPHVDAGLADAVHRAMAPLAKDRLSSISELRQAIEGAQRGGLPAAPAQPPRPSPAPPAPVVERGSAVPRPVGAHMVAAAGTPATNPPDDERGAVPRTVPPDHRTPAANVDRAPGTPLGGFSMSAPSSPPGYTPGPAGTNADARPPSNLDMRVSHAQSAAPRAEAAFQNGGSALPPTADYDPPPPRPGGTDVSHLPFVAPYGGGHTAGGAVHGAGTAPMDPYAANVSAPYMSALPPKRKSGGGSLALILALATGVSGLVVGGLWFAHHLAQPEDSRDDPPAITVPPPAAVITGAPTAADPPPVVTPPPLVAANPTPAKPPTTTPQKPPPAKPTTTPSSKPPTIAPTVPVMPGPITFPTGLPFPGLQLPGQQPTANPGGQPPPSTGPGPGPTAKPPPGGTPTSKPGIVIRVPKKGSSSRPAEPGVFRSGVLVPRRR
jgi:serine/threonine-protein kinase